MLVISQKYGFDPGSGKYFSLISDPGGQKSTRSQIRVRNTESMLDDPQST